MVDIKVFSEKSAELVAKGFGEIMLPGNRPYKVPGGIPIWPTENVLFAERVLVFALWEQ